MKKLFLILLMMVSISVTFAQKKGDSLAILYYRVYAYGNPNDLSTRISVIPLSYRNKNKLVFIEDSEEYPGYFKIKTHKGVIAYVKSNRLSTDQNLSHRQIKQEINDGSRFRSYGVKYKIEGSNIPWWYWVIGYIVLLYIAYIFYKKYDILDRWYCKKAQSRSKPLFKPWFIRFAVMPGLVLGGLQLFIKGELRWFIAEGIQIWGSYPSVWDWILWASMMSVFVVSLIAIYNAFMRFTVKYAFIYSIISLIIIGFYFFIGCITGGLVVFIFFITGGGGGGGGSPNEITQGGVKYVRK